MEEVNAIFLDELKKIAESDYNLSSEQVNLLIGIAKDAILSGRKPTKAELKSKLEKLAME